MSSLLEKYYPETSIFKHFEIDQNLPEEDRAFLTWKALLEARRNQEGLFLVIGKLLKDIRDQKLYLKLDYEDFSQFLNSQEIGFSREKAYMYIKTFEYYVEYLELDPEAVKKMNVSRLSLAVPALKQIADKNEAIKQMEELNSLRYNDFVREVKNRSTRGGKPTVYWSEELGKWYIGYHPNVTFLCALNDFEKLEPEG